MHNSCLCIYNSLRINLSQIPGNNADIRISISQVLTSHGAAQPPRVQTSHADYASSADRKQRMEKIKKSQEAKEVAGEWKNKWWLPPPPPSPGVRGTCCMSSRCLSTQWCGDDVLGRASSEQSQGHRGDRKLNAPTVPCLQTNIWMSGSPPPPPPLKKEGHRDQRGAMAVSVWPLNCLDVSTTTNWHCVHDTDTQTGTDKGCVRNLFLLTRRTLYDTYSKHSMLSLNIVVGLDSVKNKQKPLLSTDNPKWSVISGLVVKNCRSFRCKTQLDVRDLNLLLSTE